MNSKITVTLVGLLTALCLSAALRAVADNADTRNDSLRDRRARSAATLRDQDLAQKNWQSEYRSLLSDYRSARGRSESAGREWRSERKRHRLRGETRVEARAKIAASEEALAEATDAIRKFQARARGAGVAPGWLYAVEDEFPEIASAIASQ